MEMEIQKIHILTILLIALQVKSSCLTSSKEMDAKCATYCYQVVKPLLHFVHSARSQAELQDKIKEQAAIIVHLNSQLKSLFSELQDKVKEQEVKIVNLNSQTDNLQSEVNYKDNLITDLNSQNSYKNKTILDLQSEVEHNDKLIDSSMLQISLKDKEIVDLKSELSINSEKIEKLEEELTTFEQSSNCSSEGTELQTIVIDKKKFTVACDSKLAGFGWIVIQRRMDGSVNFNRTWSEYKEGFGNLSGEFFIGLEKLHLLTQSKPHELYISLKNFKNETGYARYSEFAIGSEEESYKLKLIEGYSGNAGDDMEYHKNMKFSTPDKDNDIAEGNCAKKYSSGWLFYNCYACNLNGKYIYEDTDKDVKGIEWRHWEWLRPLKFTQMMIRPKSG